MSNSRLTPPALPVEPEAPKDFIIRNNSAGPLCINDMKISLEPFEALDLTWEDPKVVRGSKHLARQLTIGSASQISREDYDNIKNAEIYAEMDNLNIDPKSLRRNGSAVDADGRTFKDADEFDLKFSNSEAERKEYLKEISYAGIANDPLLYAQACKQAQAQAKENGRPFDAKVFAEQWSKKDRASIRRLASSLSGANKSKAYVASQYGNETYAVQANTGNLNRDGRLDGFPDNTHFAPIYQPQLIPDTTDMNANYGPGMGDPYGDSNFAEEIDLSSGGGSANDGNESFDEYSGLNHAPISRIQ